MNKLTVFYLEGCPYCRMGRKAAEELQKESSAYAKIEIDWIEENGHPEIADNYDYYRVPSIFFGEEKLYECSPLDGYEEIKRKFERAMKTVLHSHTGS